MAVGTADYAIKNLNEKTNAEIEGFLKKSKEDLQDKHVNVSTDSFQSLCFEILESHDNCYNQEHSDY